MTTSKSTNFLNRFSNKIDAALHLTSELVLDFEPRIRHQNNKHVSSLKPFDLMLDEYFYATMQDPLKYILASNISSDFPFYKIIPKSALLDDKVLFDTLTKSLMFADESIFESHRHIFWKGEFVWVKRKGTGDEVEAMLVHSKNTDQQDIIYSIRKSVLDEVRENVQKTWNYLKYEVKLNILDEFEDLEAWIPDDKSKVNDAAPRTTEMFISPMTDEVKKIFIEELDIIQNLDPVVKQQLIFDLKVLPDLDVYEWCDKMDLLRACFRNTTKSEDVLQLHKTVETLENVTTRNSTSLDYIVAKLKQQESTCTQISKQSSSVMLFDSKNSLFDKKVGNKSPVDKQVGSTSTIDKQVSCEKPTCSSASTSKQVDISKNPTGSHESTSQQLYAKNLKSRTYMNPASVIRKMMSTVSDFSYLINVNKSLADDLSRTLSYFQKNYQSLDSCMKTNVQEMKIEVKGMQKIFELMYESVATAKINENYLTSMTERMKNDYNYHFPILNYDAELEHIFDCNKTIFYNVDDQIKTIRGVISWLDENKWLRYLAETILPDVNNVKGDPPSVKFTAPEGKILEAAVLFQQLSYSQVEIVQRVQEKVSFSQKLIDENTRRGYNYGY